MPILKTSIHYPATCSTINSLATKYNIPDLRYNNYTRVVRCNHSSYPRLAYHTPPTPRPHMGTLYVSRGNFENWWVFSSAIAIPHTYLQFQAVVRHRNMITQCNWTLFWSRMTCIALYRIVIMFLSHQWLVLHMSRAETLILTTEDDGKSMCR